VMIWIEIGLEERIKQPVKELADMCK